MNRLKYRYLAITILFLAGCSTGNPVNVKNGVKKVEPVAADKAVQAPVMIKKIAVRPISEATPTTGVEECDRELNVLKKLDPRRYALRRAQFSRLMSGASMYAGLRTEVAGGTRETVDAMYRFQTGKLCAEISRDVLEALSSQGSRISGEHD